MLENHKPDTEISDQSQEKGIKYIGNMTPHKGHTLYQFNTETNVLSIAQFEDASIDIKGNVTNSKVIIQPNSLYFSCLNVKNAMRYVKKINPNVLVIKYVK